MAKRRKSTKSNKKSLYRAETYGIKYGSTTFLLFLAFVAVVAMIMVASMTGIKLY